MADDSSYTLQKIDENRWRLPRRGSMKTDGIVYAESSMLAKIYSDRSLLQLANVAALPGIIGCVLAMPDIHWGYGFPIGGVAAFSLDDGIISPGGVGYDINCGVRLYKTSLARSDIISKRDELVSGLCANIPSGVGSQRKDLRLSNADFRHVITEGASWAVARGYGTEQDLEHTEDRGCLPGADPGAVSEKAVERGRPQLGTLGSGNHFVEIACVDEIYEPLLAERLGLYENRITVSVHTGSRGFGYQVCDDSLKAMLKASRTYDIPLPDRQLCCAPLSSQEGKTYLSAMAGAANYAFTNRQIIGYWVQQTFERILKASGTSVGMELVYDVCHNIAKIETHTIDNKHIRVCVHRKGATRAFPPGNKQIPAAYTQTGQPVLIPGDMGRYSYVLVGTSRAMEETFGSCCHGAGRALSRHQAKKAARGRALYRELQDKGICVRTASKATLAEEMPEAYKDVSRVVDVVHAAGLARKVVRLRPLGVMKG